LQLIKKYLFIVLLVFFWSCEDEENKNQDSIIGTWNLSSVCELSDCDENSTDCSDVTDLYIEDEGTMAITFFDDGTAIILQEEYSETLSFGWSGSNPYIGSGEGEGITFTLSDGILTWIFVCLQVKMTKND
tara:strand:+ start:495 stop:887 length:393 start_codon:yes stop_codon:yes gene_type:complete